MSKYKIGDRVVYVNYMKEYYVYGVLIASYYGVWDVLSFRENTDVVVTHIPNDDMDICVKLDKAYVLKQVLGLV